MPEEPDKLADKIEKLGIVAQHRSRVTIQNLYLGKSPDSPAPPDEGVDSDEMPDCPYRGLFAFREQDAEFFFGRENDTKNLVRAVETQRLVAVIGASGSGKSSVVFAGLIPELRATGNWLIESFRPQRQPLYGLASALVRLLKPELDEIQQPGRAAELLADLEKGTLSLVQVVASIAERNSGKRLLLFVDQFEELYTLCKETHRQTQFINVLLEVLQFPTNQLTLVFTLRADFFNSVLSYRPFKDALNQQKPEFLSGMNPEELQLAIERPAELKGVELEAGLTERILDDVRQEPGNLPLLEFALSQLWTKQSHQKLTHQAYTAIGGVAKALANHAEDVYAGLSEAEQRKVKRIFLQLVQLGEGAEDTRRLATRTEVGNWELVTFLASEEARLVVTGYSKRLEEEVVEVVHEALIREWYRLHQWINKNREQLRQQRRIEAAAKEWDDNHRFKGYLLRGKPLADARAFQKEQAIKIKFIALKNYLIHRQELKVEERNHLIRRIKKIVILAMPISNLLLRNQILEAKKFFKQQSGVLSLSKCAEEFIRVSTNESWKSRWRNPFIVGIMLSIAILIIYQVVDPFLKAFQRQQEQLERDKNIFEDIKNLEQARLIIKTRGQGIQGAIKILEASCARLARYKVARQDCQNLSGIDFRNLEFSGISLSGYKLNGAILSSAILRNASLENADFANANLSDADLRHASLNGAVLVRANLRRANLQDASLVNANLDGADLRGANLQGALYSQKTQFPKDFIPEEHQMHLVKSNADLRGANLRGANLCGINLRDAQLSGADLHSTVFLCKKEEPKKHNDNSYDDYPYDEYRRDPNSALSPRPRLGGIPVPPLGLGNIPPKRIPIPLYEIADLSGANLSNTNLTFSQLNQVKLVDATLVSADLSNANLSRADLSNATLNDSNLSRADLRGTDLKGTILNGANLDETDLSSTIGLTVDQVKVALNPEKATYNQAFCDQLLKELGWKECWIKKEPLCMPDELFCNTPNY